MTSEFKRVFSSIPWPLFCLTNLLIFFCLVNQTGQENVKRRYHMELHLIIFFLFAHGTVWIQVVFFCCFRARLPFLDDQGRGVVCIIPSYFRLKVCLPARMKGTGNEMKYVLSLSAIAQIIWSMDFLPQCTNMEHIANNFTLITQWSQHFLFYGNGHLIITLTKRFLVHPRRDTDWAESCCEYIQLPSRLDRQPADFFYWRKGFSRKDVTLPGFKFTSRCLMMTNLFK